MYKNQAHYTWMEGMVSKDWAGHAGGSQCTENIIFKMSISIRKVLCHVSKHVSDHTYVFIQSGAGKHGTVHHPSISRFSFHLLF